jgi:hypothetical protein
MTYYELKLESQVEKHKIFKKFMKGKTHLYFKIMFLGQEVLVLRQNPQSGETLLVGCPLLLIYIHSHYSYVAVVFYSLNKRRLHAMVRVLEYTNMRFRSSAVLRGVDL